MKRGMRGAALVVALALGAPVAGDPREGLDPEVAQGIRLAEEGDFDSAILALDTATRRLASRPGQAADLAQGYLYLGIAFVGKGQEAAARARFRDALARTRDLSLSADKFPPKVINLFEAAKEEAARAAGPGAVSPKKSGGRKAGLIVGALAAVGGGAALAAGGGSSGGASAGGLTTDTLGPATLPADASERGISVLVASSGTLTGTVSWQDASVLLGLYVVDGDANQVIAQGSQTGGTEAKVTVSVAPGASGPKGYQVTVIRGPGEPKDVVFTLTVVHP